MPYFPQFREHCGFRAREVARRDPPFALISFINRRARALTRIGGDGTGGVSLGPYIGEANFDPTAIAAMTTAFHTVCDALLLVDREDPIIEIVALKVIEIARTGERAPERIRDLTLRAFNEGQRSS